MNFETCIVLDFEEAKNRRRSNEMKPPRRPRVLDVLDLAEKLQLALDQGLVNRRSELSALYGISRARVSQVLGLLKLDPLILDFVRRAPGELDFLGISPGLLFHRRGPQPPGLSGRDTRANVAGRFTPLHAVRNTMAARNETLTNHAVGKEYVTSDGGRNDFVTRKAASERSRHRPGDLS